MIRKLIGVILSVIIAVVLFILLVAFFPSRKKTVNVVNIRYIFVDTNGNEYDLFEKGHGAAEDRSFLLEDYVGEFSENSNIETGFTEGGHNLNPDNPYNLPKGAIEKSLPKDCETPRGIKIKDKESILAYQQRNDVPDICNVQRRTCNDGILEGSFTQPSCNEKVTYIYNGSNNTNKETNTISYTKKTVIARNDVSQNELIQPPKYTKNEWAKFDENGKLQKGNESPKTDWNSNTDPKREMGNYNSVEQKNKTHFNCSSPRGEIVQHGQFIRAYELPFGFTNASCNVELRLCVDGELMGNYTYKDCQYLDVTYEEYNNITELQAEEGIYGKHEITNETKQGFRGRLKNLFN